MRVFVAGATGVLGIRIVPLLVSAGHVVAGMTRSPGNAPRLRGLGAESVVCDVFDSGPLEAAVVAFRPDLVMHQLTDLPDDPAALPRYVEANARIRREGTHNLLAAAQAAGTTRFFAQSVAWPLTGDGAAAVDEHERSVLSAGGVVLRYGRLYGPGTYHQEERPPPPRIHVDEAARRTLDSLGHPSGVVVLDER